MKSLVPRAFKQFPIIPSIDGLVKCPLDTTKEIGLFTMPSTISISWNTFSKVIFALP